MASLNKLSLGLFSDTQKYAIKLKANESVAYSELNLNEIIDVDFPENQFYKEQAPKKQIVLHHTVSGDGTEGDISWWRQTPEKIATAVIIGRDGKIYQCFSSEYWAYHLGTNTYNDYSLNKNSIGIEIDSWGGLTKKGTSWYSSSNTLVKNVVLYPQGYKGFYAFEKYTDAQINAVHKLLVYWGGKYKIPLNYNSDMFNQSSNALAGKPGVWTHVSYRQDKSDCHPQIELVNMLKSLV